MHYMFQKVLHFRPLVEYLLYKKAWQNAFGSLGLKRTCLEKKNRESLTTRSIKRKKTINSIKNIL